MQSPLLERFGPEGPAVRELASCESIVTITVMKGCINYITTMFFNVGIVTVTVVKGYINYYYYNVLQSRHR